MARRIVKHKITKRKWEYIPPDEDYDLPSEELDIEKFENTKQLFLELLSNNIDNIERTIGISLLERRKKKKVIEC